MRGYNPAEVDLYIEEVKFRAGQADTGKGS
jgi:hypothetical protein